MLSPFYILVGGGAHLGETGQAFDAQPAAIHQAGEAQGLQIGARCAESPQFFHGIHRRIFQLKLFFPFV